MIEKQKVIIGGGAAGFFAAINLAERGFPVLLFEKNRQVLSKVRVSGGGRCNVTHACFDPKELIKNYPRGGKELLGPFSRFGPAQTIEWFAKRGVELKIEEDKRMFPTTDSSETIISCFLQAARQAGVIVKTEAAVSSFTKDLTVSFDNQETIQASSLLIATGSSTKMWHHLQDLGHTLVEPIPSLFTLNTPSSPFLNLAGITLERARIFLEDGSSQTGPLLFTHWGFSGPVALRLSAFAAKTFHDKKYYTMLSLDFAPDLSEGALEALIEKKRQEMGSCVIKNFLLLDLPRRLWEHLISFSTIKPTQVWAQLSSRQKKLLIQSLKRFQVFMEGKTTYKEEFVTCGGVALDEVDFQTLESKKIKGLFFAGEALNIDGITGGFNFQAAWTTSFIASQHM